MDESYQLYSKIAPTYRVPDEVLGDAEETLKIVADLLGIPEKATSVLTDYKQKIADTKVKLEEVIGRETVAVVRLDVGDKPELRLFGLNNAYTGMIYKDLGLEPFKWVKNIKAHDVISQEKSQSLPPIILSSSHLMVRGTPSPMRRRLPCLTIRYGKVFPLSKTDMFINWNDLIGNQGRLQRIL